MSIKNADSQSKNALLGAEGTCYSVQTTKSARVQQQIKNNQVFVYKIIHDLRHPTEALSNGLRDIIADCSVQPSKPQRARKS